MENLNEILEAITDKQLKLSESYFKHRLADTTDRLVRSAYQFSLDVIRVEINRRILAKGPDVMLWKLARITPATPPWDKYEGFVVRAPDEMHARNLANLEDPKSENIWLDPASTTCKPIYHQGPPQVILADFHAG